MTIARYPTGYCSVRSVCPDHLQPRKLAADFLQQRFGRIAVLHIGREHQHAPDQTEGVYQQVPLAARDFFAASYPRSPPTSVVFTD